MDASRAGDGELCSLLQDSKPRVVGITSTTPSFPNALDIAKTVKRVLPESFVVIGGAHATARPDEALSCPYVDVAVRGEGEYTVVELGAALIWKKKPLEMVHGISFRNNSKNIVHNPASKAVEDLDVLPFPARDLIDLGSYAQTGAILTSRGCLRRCVFCACGLSGSRSFRLRSAQGVVDEMIFLNSKYGISRFEFHDDAFTTDMERAHDICRLITGEYSLAATDWGCHALASNFDESLADKMAAAGCRCVQFGIESGNTEILQKTGKGISLADAENAVRSAHKAGIPVIVTSFIIGFPWDTAQTVEETVDFTLRLRDLGATHTPCSVLTPFPGTIIGEHLEQFGINVLSKDWERYTFNQVLIETENFSASDLRQLYAEAIFRLVDEQLGFRKEQFQAA